VALYFAGTGALTVDELNADESLRLLTRFVPTLVAQESTALRTLARLVGGLPLALQLIGIYLRTQVYSGQPRRWRAALECLKQPVARLQLIMPRAPLERQMGLPAGAPISLYNEIELSYQRLAPASRLALHALAGLFFQAVSFSEERALALQGVTLEALDQLLDAGLLASTGLGRYTLHQTIADFASFQEELAQGAEEMPPQLSVLRQLREHGGSYQLDHSETQAYELHEVIPARVQKTGEIVSV
jgi:hypothetical protein